MSHTDRHKKSDFQRAVLRAAYRSPQQRRRRAVASMVLFAKHVFGGIVFVWPLVLVLIAALHTTEPKIAILFVLLALPGVLAWALIFFNGTRKDYDRLVRDQILSKGFIRRLH